MVGGRQEAYSVVGLGLGDEGKGSLVDYLVRKTGARLVVRYNGGPQALHHVVTPEGKEHGFSQFGAGTLAGADTLLARDVLVNPLNMMLEAAHLEELGINNPLSKVVIDPRCLVITPWAVMANRDKELARGSARHGSCGEGIGETVSAAIAGYGLPVDLLSDKDKTAQRLKEIKRYFLSQGLIIDKSPLISDLVERYYDWTDRVWIIPAEMELASAMRNGLVLEGAQGVLLDELYGFHPYTTWSQTTDTQARELLDSTDWKLTRIGVVRAYATRHGPGPFPTEDHTIPQLDKHNDTGQWQGPMRYGHFDRVLFDYALRANYGVDKLAITCCDQLSQLPELKICHGYESFPGRLPLPDGLKEQEILTAVLSDVKPLYKAYDSLTDYLIDLSWWRHSKPVETMLSWGPTWVEKTDFHAIDPAQPALHPATVHS